MHERKAPASAPIHDLLASRWSPRAYDATRPVEREKLRVVLEAGRWAPSCYGDEPWRFLIWDRARDPDGWQLAFECLVPGNRTWCRNVPVLMLSCAAAAFARDGTPNRWGPHDTGMATLSMALQAVACGLVVHQMGGFDLEQARETFAIPAEYTPMAMIALGYLAPLDVLDDPVRAKELRPRTRAALGDRYFEGGWGEGVRFQS